MCSVEYVFKMTISMVFCTSLIVFATTMISTSNAALAASSDTVRDPFSDFKWSQNKHDVPQFISELHNNGHRHQSLLDKAIVRAEWNVLAAKLFRVVSVFFIESYLIQLFGVTFPLP